MEILIVIAAVAVLWWIIVRNRAIHRKPRLIVRTANFDPSPKWSHRDFEYGHDRKARGFVLLPGGNDINVVDTSHRLEACLAFIKSAPQRGVLIELERRPAPQHPNSIAVFGRTSTTADRVHLGYLPSDLSQDIANSYSTDMPLGAELRRAGEHLTENAVFIAINVLAPPAKERRHYAQD